MPSSLERRLEALEAAVPKPEATMPRYLIVMALVRGQPCDDATAEEKRRATRVLEIVNRKEESR